MKRDASLAEEIGHIREAVKDIKHRGHYSGEEVDLLIGRLLAAQRVAQANELELDIYRRDEAGQRGRSVLENLATDTMGDLLTPGSNVIRPDHWGRS